MTTYDNAAFTYFRRSRWNCSNFTKSRRIGRKVNCRKFLLPRYFPWYDTVHAIGSSEEQQRSKNITFIGHALILQIKYSTVIIKTYSKQIVLGCNKLENLYFSLLPNYHRGLWIPLEITEKVIEVERKKNPISIKNVNFLNVIKYARSRKIAYNLYTEYKFVTTADFCGRHDSRKCTVVLLLSIDFGEQLKIRNRIVSSIACMQLILAISCTRYTSRMILLSNCLFRFIFFFRQSPLENCFVRSDKQ